ncbi:unnamed protein product [Prunus armeniaca]
MSAPLVIVEGMLVAILPLGVLGTLGAWCRGRMLGWSWDGYQSRWRISKRIMCWDGWATLGVEVLSLGMNCCLLHQLGVCVPRVAVDQVPEVRLSEATLESTEGGTIISIWAAGVFVAEPGTSEECLPSAGEKAMLLSVLLPRLRLSFDSRAGHPQLLSRNFIQTFMATCCTRSERRLTRMSLRRTKRTFQDNESLMRALSKLVNLNNPDLVLFVGEALVGNDVVDQLSKFNQLLDEMIDNGFPLTIEPNILREMIAPPNIVNKMLSVVTGNSSNMSDTLPSATSSCIPWRTADPKYANNEVYVDLVEEIDTIDGVLVKCEIYGEVQVNSHLSSVPDLTLSFANPSILDDKKGKGFWAEFELYAVDLLVGITIDIALVGMLAPMLELESHQYDENYLKVNNYIISFS